MLPAWCYQLFSRPTTAIILVLAAAGVAEYVCKYVSRYTWLNPRATSLAFGFTMYPCSSVFHAKTHFALTTLAFAGTVVVWPFIVFVVMCLYICVVAVARTKG